MTTILPVLYIGDELEGAGYRLAGVEARAPRRGTEAECFDAARAEAALVLLGSATAARIPAESLDAALAGAAPLVVIVPQRDRVDGHAGPAQKVRRLLGAET